MQPAREKYMEMSRGLFPAKEYEQLIGQFWKAEGKEVLARKAELLLPYDLKIVCAMLDEGYSLRDIAAVLNECSMFAKHLPELMPDERRRYADEVMKCVNEFREREISKDYKLAEGIYLLRASGKKLNIAQEGDIVLSLLTEGFTPETVERILQAHGAEEEHARGLARTCFRISKMYSEIQAADPDPEISTAKDAYQSLAGEYMRDHKLSKLDVKSDRDIVRRMYSKGWNEEFIRNALRFSPVAAEPWRSREQYVDAVCSYVLRKQKNKKGANDRYALTASMYEEKMNRLQQDLRRKNATSVDTNRKYYDGIVARELLEEHQLRGNIERVIAEKSPQAKKEMKLSSKSRYASVIVSAAYAVLRAEYELLEVSPKNIPAGNSYAALKKQGITAEDLYKDAILRRVHDYPSTAGMLTASFVDRDAVEYLLSRYPDMERHDLEDALHFGSPRAQMPGIDLDYPIRVLDEVNERMEALSKLQKKRLEFRKEMEESVQSEKAAFTAGCPTWNLALCTGLAAVRMLEAGYTSLDVLPVLIQPPDISEQTAQKIMDKAEDVLDRMESIKKHIPFSNENKEYSIRSELAEDDYKKCFQNAQSDKDRLMSHIDIEIARTMMLKDYTREEIRFAIAEYSPVAAEPGRSEDYAEYVVKQAEIDIEKERERLKYYRPMPRNEHDEDAEKEYEYHMSNMRSSFFLPYAPAMDTLIAETMLAQGFQAVAIGAAMQKLSPCANNDEQYGNSIMRSFGAKAKGFSRSTELPARVRTLG